MPLPGAPGALPLFDGINITEFLMQYKSLCKDYCLPETEKVKRFLWYCTCTIAETVKFFEEWEGQDFDVLKKALLEEYRDKDTFQQEHSVSFLERYKSIPRTEQDDILNFCCKFKKITEHCIKRGTLSKYTAGVWLLHRLLSLVTEKAIRKLVINVKEPSTIDYLTILKFAMQRTRSNKSIEHMNAERINTECQINQLAGKLQKPAMVEDKDEEEIETVQTSAA
jgi:hypothetical protein